MTPTEDAPAPSTAPWLAPELLTENPHPDGWSILTSGRIEPITLEALQARIEQGEGQILWNGKPEREPILVVGAPGRSRLVPVAECPELEDPVLARHQMALVGDRRSSAWIFYPLTALCLVLLAADLGPYALLPAVFAIGAGSDHLEAWIDLWRIRSRPSVYLRHRAAEVRFGEWLHIQTAKGWPRGPLMVAAWLVVSAVQLFSARGAERADVVAAALVKTAVAGEPWRLLTGPMLHGSLMHIAMNVSALISVSVVVEGAANRRMLVPIWLAGALAGSLLSWAASPLPSVGASGGIMAVIGFLTVMGWRRRTALPPNFLHGFLRTLMWMAMLGALAWGVIDNAAHAGGALAGALIGLALFRKPEGLLPLPDTTVNRIMGTIAEAFFVLLTIFTMAKLLGLRLAGA